MGKKIVIILLMIITSFLLIGGEAGAVVPLIPGKTLTTINVTPTNPVIAVGQTQQFTATGLYDDGSTHVFGTSVPSIAPGNLYTCAGLSDGIARCWGDNRYGQLGNGVSGNGALSYIPVSVSGIDNAVEIATSHVSTSGHTCAILSDGVVKCWGKGNFGALGNGDTVDSSVPVTVSGIDGMGSNPTAIGIDAGRDITCVVLSNTKVRCWGANGLGQLGNGTDGNNISTPTDVVNVDNIPISNAIGVSTGAQHSCVLLSDGRVMCMGNNTSGQLGNGNTILSNTASSVIGIGGNQNPAIAIATGGWHTCAILSDGTVSCWGKNQYGQLGNGLGGVYQQSSTPVDVNWIGRIDPVTGNKNPGAIAISAGDDFTCALLSNNNIMCWGDNRIGQLGAGSGFSYLTQPDNNKLVSIIINNNSIPVTATAIAAGEAHACAVLLNNKIQCWGRNSYGQVGNGSNSPSRVYNPTDVKDYLSVQWISSDQAVASIDLQGAARGINNGITTITASVDGITGSAILQVVACIDNDNDGYGSPGSILCTNGSVTDCDDSNATIHPNATEICNDTDDNCNGQTDEGFSGLGNACSNGTGACLALGMVVCTQDGIGSMCNAVPGTPTAEVCNGIDDDCDGVVDNGVLNIYYRDADGDGFGDYLTSTNACTLPVGYDTDNTDCNDANASINIFALEIKNNGNDDDCNPATSDQGKTMTSISVTPVNSDITVGQKQAYTATALYNDSSTNVIGTAKSPLSTGSSHTCIVLANGAIQCWGDNQDGQLGDGTNNPSYVPVTVDGITNAVGISNGMDHSCALLSDGTVKCWGNNVYGQLGIDPLSVRNSFIPVPISGISNAVDLVSGDAHVCAILSDATVSCWGSNLKGELGRGFSGGHSHIPDGVFTIESVKSITAGNSHSCAIANGRVWCWGSNFSGELGDGTNTPSSVPVEVMGINNAVSLGSGIQQTCAVLLDGTVKCWGDNQYGKLGDGTEVDSNTPVSVSGITNAILVSVGDYHTCAILSDGLAKCWGYNMFGELGNETYDNSYTPVLVSRITNVTSIEGGSSFTCAVLADGTAWCWGNNHWGNLGNGSSFYSFMPVSVSNINNAAIGVVWDSSNPTTASIRRNDGVALGNANGTTTIYASSGGITGSTTLIVDNVIPAGAIVINGGAIWTKNSKVTLTLSCTDNTGGSGCADMQLSNDGVFDTEAWEPFVATKTWAINAGNGVRIVYVRYSDRAGNISLRYSDSISLDTLRPVLSGISDTPDPVSPRVGGVSTISYTVSDNKSGTCTVTTNIYNSSNARVRQIMQFGVTCSKIGTVNTIIWNGKNGAGGYVPAGTYSYKIQATDKAGNITTLPITPHGTITVM